MLVLRLAIVPLFVWGLVYAIRNWKAEDRRLWIALAAGLAVASMGAASLVLSISAGSTSSKTFELVVGLSGVTFLGLVVAVVCYCGVLLGDFQGGYWIKVTASRNPLRALLVCSLVVVGLAVIAMLAAHLLHIPLNGAYGQSGRKLAAALCTHVAYSIGEEVFYRGCGQALLISFLRRLRYREAISVVALAVVFMAQHVDPNFQTFRNITAFSGGIAFGFVFVRYGLVPSAIVHLTSTIVGLFLLPALG